MSSWDRMKNYHKQGLNFECSVKFVVNEKVNIENQSLNSLNIIDSQQNRLIVSYEKSKLNIEELINFISKQNIKISDITTDDGDLEDVFVRLTKN